MGTILIKNGLLVDTEWIRREDILIVDEKISRIAKKINPNTLDPETEIIDAEGMCVMPGFIDAHTHYGLVSRGTVTADKFEEGSKCAAYGGCTTVIDFADQIKGKTLFESAEARINEMKDRMAVDYALHQGVYGSIPDNIETQLDELSTEGINIIKIFTTYKNVGYLIEKKKDLERLFKAATERKMLITAHCEDNDIIEKTEKNWKGDFSAKSHADLRSDDAEAKAITFLGEIALKCSAPLYIVHLSSAEGLEAVRDLREKGAQIFVETTPTYLYKNKSLLERKDAALFVMTPPLRTADDNETLQTALEDGEIQVIATDHCAFTIKQKLDTAADCRKTYPGVPGTSEMFSAVHTFGLAHGGWLKIQQMVNLMSTSPAKLFGLYPRKGCLHIGSDADIVIFNPEEEWKPADSIVSASGYTMFFDDVFVGKVKKTYLRGTLIMGDGFYLGIPGDGKLITEGESVAFKYPS